jgi:hypothetical protein
MLVIIFRYIAIISATFLLSGCLGAGIAQQIASSIVTRIADRAIANAMDVQDGPSNRKPNSSAYNGYANNTITSNTANSNNKGLAKNTTLQNSQLDTYQQDPYQTAFMNAAFEPVKAVSEPIPQQQVEETEARIAITDGNQLVRVELFNLLIGDEKNAVYEKARLLGATNLPQKREWQRWSVGTGAFALEGQSDKKIITFLIPPEFGKLPSGSITMVELASPGELNVARYKDNEKDPVIKAIAKR